MNFSQCYFPFASLVGNPNSYTEDICIQSSLSVTLEHAATEEVPSTALAESGVHCVPVLSVFPEVWYKLSPLKI